MNASAKAPTGETASSMSHRDELEKGRPTLLVPEDKQLLGGNSFWHKVASWGVEPGGIDPIPVEHRTDTRFINVFSIWFTMSLNLLPIVTGTVGTLIFGLGLRDAALCIVFFCLICTIPPAYLSTLGPKTGLRQMVQARYSFGYFGVWIVVLLNLATLVGFCVISTVIGGQSLSAVGDGSLSWDVGIVIIAVLAMFLSFAGYRALHLFERYAWIPVLIAIIIATGCGGKNLKLQADIPPATAAQVLAFGGLIAGFLLPWGGVASDFSTLIHPGAPSWRIFLYTYLGLYLPTVLLMTLGAAIGGAVPNIPEWAAAYETGSAGGILAAMLEPAGGFGKFVVVILALSPLGNVAGTCYAISLNFQTIAPYLWRVPRGIYAVITAAVVIPVAIKAADSFFVALENFIGIIGYWSAAFVSIVILEHIVFRKRNCASYDPAIYNDWRSLPTGIPAVAAGALSFALIIPCMSQVWYTGPIAARSGDIGFEVAIVLAGVLYVPMRALEIKWRGRV